MIDFLTILKKEYEKDGVVFGTLPRKDGKPCFGYYVKIGNVYYGDYIFLEDEGMSEFTQEIRDILEQGCRKTIKKYGR